MDWSLSSAKPAAAFSTPSASAGGKLTGGGSVSSAGGGGVSITRLTQEGVQTHRLCCGLIGSQGKKMCIAQDCTVRSHMERKANVEGLLTQPAVFIQTKQGDAVYLDPWIPASRLGPDLAIERYLMENRTIDEWDTFLRGLAMGTEGTNAEQENSARTLFEKVKQNREEQKGITPMRKRPKLNVTSPILAADFEVSMVEVADSLGSEDGTLMLDTLQAEWRNLTFNVATMQEMLTGCKDAVLRLTKATQQEFEDVDFNVTTLANLVGSRTKEMDPESVFEALKHLKDALESKPSVTETDRQILSEMVRFVQQQPKRELKLKADIGQETVTSFQPLIQLFSKWSSDKAQPGDLLEQEIRNLKAEVSILKQKTKATPQGTNAGQPPISSSTQASMNWGLQGRTVGTAPGQGTMGLQNPQTTGTGSPQAAAPNLDTRAQINTMEQRIQTIEDQMISQRVELGGETFKSLAFTKAWLATNAPSKVGYIFFADAHSLLTMASTRSVIDAAEVLDIRTSALKSGFENTQEAIVVASFDIELPAFFGKDDSSGVAIGDTRVLPAIKDFKAWDTGDAYTGARYRLTRQLEAASRYLIQGAGNQLQGIAHILAVEAIGRSSIFLAQLANWISRQYTDLTNRGGPSGSTWTLISHCVRAIFSDLHKARESGMGPFQPGEQAAGVMWGCLQGLRKMKEYSEVDFSGHPKLSHILNLHLQDNAVMKPTYNAFQTEASKTLDHLVKTVDKLQKAHDQLATKVNNKLK